MKPGFRKYTVCSISKVNITFQKYTRSATAGRLICLGEESRYLGNSERATMRRRNPQPLHQQLQVGFARRTKLHHNVQREVSTRSHHSRSVEVASSFNMLAPLFDALPAAGLQGINEGSKGESGNTSYRFPNSPL